MLTAAIYPMPYYDPTHALRVLVTNPLLLTYEPGLVEETIRQSDERAHDKKWVLSTAMRLLERRDRHNAQAPAEPQDKLAMQDLLMLCDSKHLPDEKPGLRRKIMLARPSEYAWLRGLIEEAITVRVAVEEAKHLIPA